MKNFVQAYALAFLGCHINGLFGEFAWDEKVRPALNLYIYALVFAIIIFIYQKQKGLQNQNNLKIFFQIYALAILILYTVDFMASSFLSQPQRSPALLYSTSLLLSAIIYFYQKRQEKIYTTE